MIDLRSMPRLAVARRRDGANRYGGAYALTVLTPVLREQEPGLRETLAGLPRDLFTRVPSTHFARFVIIDALPSAQPPPDPDRLQSPQLLFSSTFDGELAAYVDQLCAALAAEAESIWGRCAGFEPGTGRDPRRLERFLRRHQLRTGLFFSAYPGADVQRVRQSLKRRGALKAFLMKAEGLAPEQLQAEFLRRFCKKGAAS